MAGKPLKDGDWNCAQCGAHNFWRRATCHWSVASLRNTTDREHREAISSSDKLHSKWILRAGVVPKSSAHAYHVSAVNLHNL